MISPTPKSSMLNREQWINNSFDAGMDKPFEGLLRNTDRRDQRISLSVLSGFSWLCDCDYKSSSPDFERSDVVQAGREEAT